MGEFMVRDLSITRNYSEGADGAPINVNYSITVNGTTVAKSKGFDFLVYSAPQRVAHKYIKDMTEFEQELFSQNWEGATLRTQVWAGPPIPSYSDSNSNAGLLYVADNVVDGKQGTWMGDNSINIFRHKRDFSDQQLKRAIQYWDRDIGDLDRQPPATSDVHSYVPGSHHGEKEQLRAHFQLYEQIDVGKTLERELTSSLAEWAPSVSGKSDFLNGTYAFPWPYFSRFDTEGVRLGRPWDLFDAQGTDRMPHTWHVGGSVVFESVNDILSYNLQLLHTHGHFEQPFEGKPILHHWSEDCKKKGVKYCQPDIA